MSKNTENEYSFSGLAVEKGQRHCKIMNEEGETIFKTTSIKDAETFVKLCDENKQLRLLLDSRGIAPHRIYLLAYDESKRGHVYQDNLPAHEVVITAKAEDGVVVRHLHDGKEEIVDLDELEPIRGGSYLRAAEIHDETVQVVVRYDREEENQISIAVFREKDNADDLLDSWQKSEEAPGQEYTVKLSQSEGDDQFYRGEVSIED